MRSEIEIRRMIEELREIAGRDRQMGDSAAFTGGVAWAVIAALENVLDGPRQCGWCGCLGPAGCCICMMRSLALEPKP